MNLNVASTIVLVSLGLIATNAHAEIITYNFGGTLNEPNSPNPNMMAFGNLPLGTAFTGSFSYDNSQPLNASNQVPYLGTYNYTNFSVTIGGATVTTSNEGISVYDHNIANTYPTTSPWDQGTGYPTDLLLVYTPNRAYRVVTHTSILMVSQPSSVVKPPSLA